MTPVKQYRQLMDRSLKDIVLPFLRAKGFKGSIPHLRRANGDRIDLISFQYFSGGGSFCVNIASATAEDIERIRQYYKDAENKITAHDLFGRRLMHKNASGDITDSFEFGPMIGGWAPEPNIEMFCDICKKLTTIFERQADHWWSNPYLLDPANRISDYITRYLSEE